VLILPLLKFVYRVPRCFIPSSCRARTRKLLPMANSQIYVGGITSCALIPSSSIVPALPATPKALLSLTFFFKLKDHVMRKQRVKMEAQVKRQTQVPRAASSSATSGMISLPRS
jgi:hypothetical protein